MNPGSHAAEWYYSLDGRSTVGPVPLHHVWHLVQTGQLTRAHSVRHAAWERWVLIHDAERQLGLAPGSARAPGPMPQQPLGPMPQQPPVPIAPYQPQPQFTHQQHAQQRQRAAVATEVTAPLRLASWAVDGAVLVAAALLLEAILPGVFATLFTFAAFIGYEVLLPAKGRDTLGHIATGLRVVRVESAEPLDTFVLAARAALIVLLAAPCLLGLVLSGITMFGHHDARAWHDVATGTRCQRTRPWEFARRIEPSTPPTVAPAAFAAPPPPVRGAQP